MDRAIGSLYDPTRRAVTGLRRYSIVAAIALSAIALAELGIFFAHRQSREWVLHSRNVGRLGREAYIIAVNREAALGDYIATRDSALLAIDDASRAILDAKLSALTRLAADNPSQQQRARDIAGAVTAWDSTFVAPLRRHAGAVTRTEERSLFAAVRSRIDEFLVAEDVLYEERVRRDETLGLVAILAVLAPLALMSAVFVALGRHLTTQSLTVLEQQQRIEDQAIELEQQVEELELANREMAEAVQAADEARTQTLIEAAERSRISAFVDSALGSAPVGIAFFDTELRFRRVNTMINAMRGPQAADSLVGQRAVDVIPPVWMHVLEPYLRQALTEGKPVLDVRMPPGVPNSDGRTRDLVVSFYPVISPTGETLGVGFICIDISDRTELEEQMRQAQKMEAVGRLAGGVAHDFNNLLTVIRSYCDLILLETNQNALHRAELGEIRAAADRAAALARQLLAFSRKQVIVPQSVDINDLVRGLDAMLTRLFPEEVAHDLTLDPDVGRVRADQGHLEQVLVNLAINAADAMPAGGRIGIHTTNRTFDADYAAHHEGGKPGEYVCIAVSDTGVGMDAATQEHIFEPFFTTKPPGKGTGLGLSTVYGIVRQLGGHITVHSEPLRGSTFEVCLPREVDGAPLPVPAPPVALALAAKPVTAAVVSPATILVVEDEPSVRLTIIRILERQGFQILQAAHGGEAMRVASESPARIDLVISDLMMPEMSGREFVERFSAVRPGTRVLFMSGYTDDVALQRGVLDRRQDLIEKPFTVDQITRKIQEILARDSALSADV
jgi:PAS domain S-box-containing protein